MADDPHHAPGRWRTEPVWIGTGNLSPKKATFVAPHADRLPHAIADFESFCARSDMPTITQAALAHAQFETIHPFTDGNGRVGRTLIHVLLRRNPACRAAIVPLSAGILGDPDRYIDALTAYCRGESDAIVACLADAIIDGCARGTALHDELTALYDAWCDSLRPRANSRLPEVLRTVLRHGLITPELLQRELGISRGHVARYTDPLEKASILVQKRIHRHHGIYWLAPDLLALLDEFAEAAGRREPFRAATQKTNG